MYVDLITAETIRSREKRDLFLTAPLCYFCSALPLSLILLRVLSLHLLRSASLYLNAALNPTVWRLNAFSLSGLLLRGDFYSSPAMNIILNHTATESFTSFTEIPVIKKAILYLALLNLEPKSPRGL